MAARASVSRPGIAVGVRRARIRSSGTQILQGAAGLVGLGLVASSGLPRDAAWLVALTAVIGLGVPHGALDGAVAAPLLRPRWGRAWFPVFAVPYLGLAGAVLLAWQLAPLATLAAFLAISVLHFGTEDAGSGRPFEALVRGGLPVALPALLHPAATARVFAVVARVPMPELPGWWSAAAWLWLALAAAWLLVGRPRPAVLAEMAVLAAAFLALPPLTAFTLYFIGLHAPRHMRALVRDPMKAPGVDTMPRAVRAALPIFALTLGLGAGLWPLYAAGAPDAVANLLTVTLRMLSALTVPHILLDHLAARSSRP
ncbi:beta-carotene 15,15'-monooxygenase, Brp/Blh family [Methylobacterium phyllostachyos]|uniref:Probable beta-carotene 15,15'-dioxygenase n=1 Tax=Methylobacterium phyllostachyos TaxID=582672 RepID=A0A1H0AJ70_9HYPH|nr:Brp/Blh family beta-carotene 15,15'-dioxygenase [Methylobacterium phyllostachyos]SDN33519.1 beta-carotene 15,15'-monooxygenase, Brp/Blh family [Methylobacterium phyllostachyos]